MDGDSLILGTNNTNKNQTNLSVGLGDESGSYGLHVEALDGTAVGGLSALGFGIEGISFSVSGVKGTSTSSSGVWGASTSGIGVEGGSQSGPGVVGASSNSFGVRGQSGFAVLLPPVGGGPQFQKCGVQGSSDEGTGVRGDSAHRVGVRGRTFAGDGVFGSCADQPNGPTTQGNGLHGMAPRSSPDAQTGPFAGRFDGDVTISGRLYVGGRLVAFAELEQSSVVLAAGMVDLDGKGEAIVELPKGTGNSHTDFRYQLTPIGGPAPNLHVAQQISGDKLKIAGGTSQLKVSWQVAGELKNH
jgi:hypothetical protein